MARARPRHVGVVMDGNRRWARAAGHRDARVGHRFGADHVENLLRWCDEWEIDHLTTYVLSADNVRKRPRAQVDFLFTLLETRLPELLLRSQRWSLHCSGQLALLPRSTREALIAAEEATAGRTAHVTMAIGYDPHEDIVQGVRTALARYGPRFDDEMITASLPGGPLKEIDLVIRTGGDHRLSGFFPWQTSRAEIHVVPTMWPAFTRKDFDAAMRFYAERRARYAALR